MNKLIKFGEKGHPWWIPILILNDSDNCPSTLTQALEDKYKFSINLKYLPLIPMWWIFINTLYIGTELYF